jgi:hypothetical protein
MKTVITLWLITIALASNGRADGVIVFDSATLLGSYQSDGLYNLNGLGTWNGQPIGPNNTPTDAQLELASTINFYTFPTDPNVLYVQVTGVVTTQFGYASGVAFDNITQTGIQFTLPSLGGGTLGTPALSLNFANSGQQLVFAPPDYSSEPLATTPGFGLIASGPNQLLIQTLSGSSDGFINTGWGVYGTESRIEGGGVFQLTFSTGTDVSQDIDFNNATVEAQYGSGSQYILATLAPEPSVLALICFGAAAMLGFVVRFPSRRLPAAFFVSVSPPAAPAMKIPAHSQRVPP